MKRTDILAIALWLLAIPATRWFGDISAAVCGVLGLACLVWGRFYKDELESDAVLGLQEIALAPPPQEPEAAIIKCVQVKSVSVALETYIVRETDTGLFCFCALFRNDPLSPKPKYISNLKAHIAILNGSTEVCSGYGAWINKIQNVIPLATGDEARLVLMVLSGEKAEVFAVTNSRSLPLPTRTRVQLTALTHSNIHPHLLMADHLTFAVTMIDSRDGQQHGQFRFAYEWKDGDVRVTLQQ